LTLNLDQKTFNPNPLPACYRRRILGRHLRDGVVVQARQVGLADIATHAGLAAGNEVVAVVELIVGVPGAYPANGKAGRGFKGGLFEVNISSGLFQLTISSGYLECMCEVDTQAASSTGRYYY
jgi:hypothetical protein